MNTNQIHPIENVERYVFEELLGIRAFEKRVSESLVAADSEDKRIEILPQQLAALRERVDSLEWLLDTVALEADALPLAA